MVLLACGGFNGYATAWGDSFFFYQGGAQDLGGTQPEAGHGRDGSTGIQLRYLRDGADTHGSSFIIGSSLPAPDYALDDDVSVYVGSAVRPTSRWGPPLDQSSVFFFNAAVETFPSAFNTIFIEPQINSNRTVRLSIEVQGDNDYYDEITSDQPMVQVGVWTFHELSVFPGNPDNPSLSGGRVEYRVSYYEYGTLVTRSLVLEVGNAFYGSQGSDALWFAFAQSGDFGGGDEWDTDDFYMCDSRSGRADAFLGNVHCETCRVANADGTWVPVGTEDHAAALRSDGASQVLADTVGTIRSDTVTFDDPTNGDTPFGMMLVTRARGNTFDQPFPPTGANIYFDGAFAGVLRGGQGHDIDDEPYLYWTRDQDNWSFTEERDTPPEVILESFSPASNIAVDHMQFEVLFSGGELGTFVPQPLIYPDSFDYYTNVEQKHHLQGATSDVEITAALGRNGTAGLRLWESTSSTPGIYDYLAVGARDAFVGYAFMPTQMGLNDTLDPIAVLAQFAYVDVSVYTVRFTVTLNGDLSVSVWQGDYTSGAELYRSEQNIVQTTLWNPVRFWASWDSPTTGRIQLMLNGEILYSATNLNNGPPVLTTREEIHVYCPATGSCRLDLDDYYIGQNMPAWLINDTRDLYVSAVLPRLDDRRGFTGCGDPSAHYACVNDEDVPDDSRTDEGEVRGSVPDSVETWFFDEVLHEGVPDDALAVAVCLSLRSSISDDHSTVRYGGVWHGQSNPDPGVWQLDPANPVYWYSWPLHEATPDYAAYTRFLMQPFLDGPEDGRWEYGGINGTAFGVRFLEGTGELEVQQAVLEVLGDRFVSAQAETRLYEDGVT